jgi:ornithine decarboxylase
MAYSHPPLSTTGGHQIQGRIAATLNLVYSPGIAVVVPGERYTERCQPMLEYFRMFEESYARFPGFANEIQGVYRMRKALRHIE